MAGGLRRFEMKGFCADVGVFVQESLNVQSPPLPPYLLES